MAKPWLCSNRQHRWQRPASTRCGLYSRMTQVRESTGTLGEDHRAWPGQRRGHIGWERPHFGVLGATFLVILPAGVAREVPCVRLLAMSRC